AKADRWEDWTIGIEYSREKGVYDEPIGNKSDDFLGLSLAIPLPLWNQNEGRIAEFRATQARARRELEALELNIISNIAAARARIEELSPMLSRYENETLHLAKRNVATLKASYEQGLVGMVSVLQGQQQLLELHQSYVESLGDFASALTDFQIETASYEVDL
ncbi:MAG: hypothetical protein DCC75_12210, partial [Proteobacteria bacterium]